MGSSADSIICFGVSFDEWTEFPWDTNEFGGDIEDWWLCKVQEFMASFEIYDKDGNFLRGIKPPQERLDAYYQERQEFRRQAPKLPIELVMHSSYNEPMWIIAVKGTRVYATWGEPEKFDPASLTVTDEQISTLVKFCDDYGIEHDDPAWWMVSRWG